MKRNLGVKKKVGEKLWFCLWAIGLMLGLLLSDICLSGASAAPWEAEAAKIHTADPNPVGKGEWELFLGYETTRASDSFDVDGHSRYRGGHLKGNHLLVGVIAGLFETLDVGVSGGYDSSRDESTGERFIGADDLGLVSKWKVFTTGPWGLALLPSLILPTGSRDGNGHLGTSQRHVSGGLGVVVAGEFQRWTLNLDGGLEVPFRRGEGEAWGSLWSDLAVGRQLLSWFQVQVEGNYAVELLPEGKGSQSLAATLGVLVPVGRFGRFQLGLQPVVWGEACDRSTVIHFSWVRGFP